MATFDDPLIEVVGDDPKHIARAVNVMHVSTCHRELHTSFFATG